MNAYVVQTKDMRSYTEPVLDDGSGPLIPYQPIAPVVAESYAQAKYLFLREFAGSRNAGVYWDDWTDLRARLLYKDYSLDAGVKEDDDRLWGRIHELEDHDGAECDCPEEEEEEVITPTSSFEYLIIMEEDE
jgi:hypothetical protein